MNPIINQLVHDVTQDMKPMTRERWATMSDRKKQIKVATLCGWEHFSDNYFTAAPIFKRKGEPFRLRGNKNAPDFLHDLNACVEFERVMDWSTVGAYCTLLESMDENHGITATADQRCEAFVLTMTQDEGKVHTAYEEVGYTGMAARRLVEGENSES